MKRREVASFVAAGFLGISGCVSQLAGDRSDHEKDVSEDQCRSSTQTPKSNLTTDDIQISYEMSGSSDGVEFEIFSFENISGNTLLLNGYKVILGSRSQYKIEHVTLAPSAKLSIVTYGKPSMSTNTEWCTKYQIVRRFPLDQPLFADGKATVAFAAEDGSRLVEKNFELPKD